MATEVLNVAQRTTRGKREAKRMRRDGMIPAVLYGHGKENVSLSVKASEMELAVRHNAHLVELQGAVTESALLKDVQWDPFGLQVLHIDLTRVSAHEMVTVALRVTLRGEAPGTRQGGVLETAVHEVEISCPANAIPESLELNVNALELGQSLTVGDLELPPNAVLVGPSDALIVACVEPQEMAEEEAIAGEGAEPEVIGRAEEEGEEA